MLFSVIIANPPYSTNNSKTVLWTKFVFESIEHLKDAGYVTMITPNSWMYCSSSSPENVFEFFKHHDLIYANVSGDLRRKYFNGVGSTGFSYWLLRKGSYSGLTRFYDESDQSNIDIRTRNQIPLDVSAIALSILDKFSSETRRFKWVWTGDSDLGSDLESSEYCYPQFHNTNSLRVTWNKVKTSYLKVPKVIVSTHGRYQPRLSLNSGFTGSCLAVLFYFRNKAENTQVLLDTNLYRWYVNQYKHYGFTPPDLIKTLPRIDISRRWNHYAVAKHFGLSQEEMDYVDGDWIVERTLPDDWTQS